MNYTEEQKQVIQTEEKKVIVLSSAAVGKTTILAERISHLISKGIKPEDIVAITFTNQAAEEIASRIKNSAGVHISTVHSYCNYLLLCKGIQTSSYLKDEHFDELFELVKKNPQCIQNVKYLIVDEAQDSDELQFEFFLNIINPENWMLIGDPRQSIYCWKGARPDLLLELTDKSDVKTYRLKNNYRNGSIILDFAKRILYPLGPRFVDNSISMVEQRGMVKEVILSLNDISQFIKQREDYGKWFILCRTNKELEDAIYALRKAKVPYDSFKQSDLSNKELIKKMKQNTVKVLTIHASKGLENDNVVVIGARFWNDEERRVSYVAATRAKKLLVWTKTPPKKKNYKKYKEFY